MITFGSNERSSTNPFLQTYSPKTINHTIAPISSPNIHKNLNNNWRLQPINEYQKPVPADNSIFVNKNSSIKDESNSLGITGKILISYTGSTTTRIIIRLFNIDGI
jgi:hypothetical protein